MQQIVVPVNQQLGSLLIAALHHVHETQKALDERFGGLQPGDDDDWIVPAVPNAVEFVLELREEEGVDGGSEPLGVCEREENEERDVAEGQHAALHQLEKNLAERLRVRETDRFTLLLFSA